MRSEWIPSLIAAFFGLLAAIFLVLSGTRGTAPAKKTWLRIGIIFAVIALSIFMAGRVK